MQEQKNEPKKVNFGFQKAGLNKIDGSSWIPKKFFHQLYNEV